MQMEACRWKWRDIGWADIESGVVLAELEIYGGIAASLRRGERRLLGDHHPVEGYGALSRQALVQQFQRAEAPVVKTPRNSNSVEGYRRVNNGWRITLG